MARFLPSFGRDLERKDAATQRATTTRAWLPKGFPYAPVWDMERAVKDGYERVLFVYKCIDAIASSSAQLPIQQRKGSEDGEVVASKDPILRLLNRRSNDYEDAVHFRYRLSTQFLLSKRGVFVEVVRDQAGRVKHLHLLPPHLTEAIPDPDRFVSGFRVHYAAGGYTDLPPEKVVWIKKPHPLDPYSSSTPLEAAGLTADVDYYARLYNRNFLMNDGRPGGLVAVKGQLNQDDAAELKRRFSGGPSSAGRTTVIEADDVNWVDTATTPRDAQYVEALAGTKQDLLLAFGVPESILGNASGRTYDNAGAEEAVYWRQTIRPHVDYISAAFDRLTEGGEDDELYLVHDFDSVAVLQRDKREREAKALQEFQAGVITSDEYREVVGRDPLDTPGSRVLWLSGGKIPVGKDDEDTKAAQELVPAGGGQPPPAGEVASAGPAELPAPADEMRGGAADQSGADALNVTAGGSDNGNMGDWWTKDLAGLPFPDELDDLELTAVLLGHKSLADVARDRHR